MPKNILPITIILFAVYFLYRFISSSKTEQTAEIKLSSQIFKLEVAKSITQKAKGLSGRQSLCPNCGMLFIFSSDDIQSFWMKDTSIPLDLIWVNSQGTIVLIQTALPENKPITQMTIYKNEQPAKYVIEINAGMSEKINLKAGDKINIPKIL